MILLTGSRFKLDYNTLRLDCGLRTRHSQIKLGPGVFLKCTIPVSSHSNGLQYVEYLSAHERALLKGNTGTTEYTKEHTSRLKTQRNQAQTPVKTGKPLLLSAHKSSLVQYTSNYRHYKLDCGVGGLIEGSPSHLQPMTMVEISDSLPTNPILKQPPKWNEVSEPDLITLIFTCYDSAHIRNSESAMSLFYALRMKPGWTFRPCSHDRLYCCSR